MESHVFGIRDRFATIDGDIAEAKRRYDGLKIPPKVRYIIAGDEEEVETVRNVLVPHKRLPGEISQLRTSAWGDARGVHGEQNYHPDNFELEAAIPEGTKLRIERIEGTDLYFFGNQ